MLIENEQTREVLRRIVRHITKDAALQEDLMQQALVHLWRQEGRCPGQTPSWYVQSCRFHLNNFIRLGRSVDSTKRHPTWQGNEALSAVERDPVDESEASGAVLAWVSARDMVAQLSKWLTPIEKQILTCLADGLSLREIGGRLKISHTAVIKRRRNIAALAFKLGINPLPSRLKDREG